MSHRPDPPLDAALVESLDDAIAADRADARMAARVKRRLLARLADEATAQHRTVPAGEQDWQPFAPGVRIKVLNEAAGIMSYLLRFEPGATLPAHRHPVDEECVVLEGSIDIGNRLHVSAGGFHLAWRDMLHAPIHSAGGATIFLRGASPHPAQLI